MYEEIKETGELDIETDIRVHYQDFIHFLNSRKLLTNSEADILLKERDIWVFKRDYDKDCPHIGFIGFSLIKKEKRKVEIPQPWLDHLFSTTDPYKAYIEIIKKIIPEFNSLWNASIDITKIHVSAKTSTYITDLMLKAVPTTEKPTVIMFLLNKGFSVDETGQIKDWVVIADDDVLTQDIQRF